MTTLEAPAQTQKTASNANAAIARKAMVDSQLRTSGVNPGIALEQMGKVAREDCVPEAQKSLAYMDRAIEFADGGFLPAPLVQGLILQEAAFTGEERVILVDCGSGYLATLIKPLVASLKVLSPKEALASKGKAGAADLLIIEAACEEVPANLIKQLEEGAKIITGTIEQGISRLAIGRKNGKTATLFATHDLGIPRIADFDRAAEWSF